MKVDNNVSFCSTLSLAKQQEVLEFSETGLKILFKEAIPETDMDEFISQINKFKDFVVGDGENYLVSIQPLKANDGIYMITSSGKGCNDLKGRIIEPFNPIKIIGDRLISSFQSAKADYKAKPTGFLKFND